MTRVVGVDIGVDIEPDSTLTSKSFVRLSLLCPTASWVPSGLSEIILSETVIGGPPGSRVCAPMITAESGRRE